MDYTEVETITTEPTVIEDTAPTESVYVPDYTEPIETYMEPTETYTETVAVTVAPDNTVNLIPVIENGFDTVTGLFLFCTFAICGCLCGLRLLGR